VVEVGLLVCSVAETQRGLADLDHNGIMPPTILHALLGSVSGLREPFKNRIVSPVLKRAVRAS
jgi:hypothetical protein